MTTYEIRHGDCLDVLRTLESESVDAVVTDPPYGLSFMGKKWDYDVPTVDVWAECLRVLKPGGHLLAFAGTRTQHRMAVRIEDAGFEIRDMIAWVYASGFPKSLNATEAMKKWLAGERPAFEQRAIDPAIYRVTAFLREARDKAGWSNKQIDALFDTNGMAGHWTSSTSQPAVPSLRRWKILQEAMGFGTELDALVESIGSGEREESDGEGGGRDQTFLESLKRDPFAFGNCGWGTALKPALEPITVARKPLFGTVAANVMQHGTGAINVDGCRVGHADANDLAVSMAKNPGRTDTFTSDVYGANRPQQRVNTSGRWPSNFIHDGSEECTGLLGEAARFFYVPKTSKSDREDGVETLEAKRMATLQGSDRDGEIDPVSERFRTAPSRNHHPTVKPTDLMRYLCRLVTPPNGLVLDPFTGSGSTGRGAVLEGFRFLGIEREAEYVEIARRRCSVIADAPVEYDLFGNVIERRR